MATETEHSIEISQSETCHTTFNLEGMMCASCAMHIEKGLKKVPGVTNAQVNLATEIGNVTYDPTQTDIEQLVQKVEDLGYKAIPVEQPVPEPKPEETQTPTAVGPSALHISQTDERS